MEQIGFDELDTWKICNTMGGTPRALDASCELRSLSGEKVYFRIIERHGSSKLFQVWRTGSGVATFDIDPNMNCELTDYRFACVSKQQIQKTLEMYKLDKEIRIHLTGPVVSYYDSVR